MLNKIPKAVGLGGTLLQETGAKQQATSQALPS